MTTRLEEAVRELTTRDMFRADALDENNQHIDMFPADALVKSVQIKDDDSIDVYWVSVAIPRGESVEQLDNLYIKPARLAILRELQGKNVNMGEPVIKINLDGHYRKVTILLPVKIR